MPYHRPPIWHIDAYRYGISPEIALQIHASDADNELAPKGIFVDTVMVCGVIGGNEHLAPANIAEKYWQMYQDRKDWEVRFE